MDLQITKGSCVYWFSNVHYDGPDHAAGCDEQVDFDLIQVTAATDYPCIDPEELIVDNAELQSLILDHWNNEAMEAM